MKKDQRQARPRATKTIDDNTTTAPVSFDQVIAASSVGGARVVGRPPKRSSRDGGDHFSTRPGAPGPKGPDNEKMIEWARKERRARGLADLNGSNK